MKSRKIIPVLVLAIILGGSAIGYELWNDARKNTGTVFTSNPDAQVTESAEVIPTSLELSETYNHPKYNFSFKYPKDFSVKSMPQDGGEIITVQNAKSQGFQMTVQEMDEDIRDITPELIKRDLPDIAINEPQEVSLGSAGRGTAFLSDDEAFGGASREVWFAYNKVFYQITTYPKYDPILQAILGSWKFE